MDGWVDGWMDGMMEDTCIGKLLHVQKMQDERSWKLLWDRKVTEKEIRLPVLLKLLTTPVGNGSRYVLLRRH